MAKDKEGKSLEDIKISKGDLPENLPLYDEKSFSADLSRLFLYSYMQGVIGTRCTRMLTMGVSTAGMSYDPKNKERTLMVNPLFMSVISYENEKAMMHRMGIIAHELYHLLLLHTCVRGQNVDPKIWNYAADLAVNSLIEATHGEDWISPILLLPGRGWFADFPKLKSAEFYLNMILNDENLKEKIEQDNQGNCNGDCKNCPAAPWNGGKPSTDGSGIRCPRQFDNHETWHQNHEGNELSEDEKKEAGFQDKDLVEGAYDRVSSQNGWGTIPVETIEYIKNLLKPKINWKDIVKRFHSYATSSEWRSTIKKRNRRYGLDHPGSRRKRSARILVAMDQSGSVSSELCRKFFSEIVGLAKSSIISTIHFDHSVDDSSLKKYRKGQTISASRTRCGGTNFTAIIEWANKRIKLFDALIILTDLEAPHPAAPSRLPKIWVADEGMTPWGDDPRWNNEQIVYIPKGHEVR